MTSTDERPGSSGSPAPGAAPLPRSTPEEQGVPSAALLALLRRWEERGLEPHGLQVLRHGHVVAEASWAPYRPDGIQLVYSVSKTFTACAVGFAVSEGLLSLTDRLVDLFPEAVGVAGPRAARLTLHDVLSMSTGHREDTLVWRGLGVGDFPEVFLADEPAEEPGSWFVYHNGATLMAALAVQRRSGQRLLDYLRPRLLEPLGIADAAWSSQQGSDLGYSGLHVATGALARLGELVLRDGRWEGRQVLPEGWVATMTTRHTDTSMHPEKEDWKQGYGYQMWRCRHDAVRADGAFGQFSVVVPGSDLVVALTSCTDRTQETLDAVWDELLPHLAQDRLDPDPAAHEELSRQLAGAALAAPRPAADPPPGGPWTFSHVPTAEVPDLTSVQVQPRTDGAGWTLVVTERDGLEVPCGEGTWPHAPNDRWVANGGWSAPGVFEAVVVAVQTPHALHVRCAEGVVTARWNGVPLNRPVLATQRAPRAR